MTFIVSTCALRLASGLMQPCVSRFRLRGGQSATTTRIGTTHTMGHISLSYVFHIVLLTFSKNFKFIAPMKRYTTTFGKYELLIICILVLDGAPAQKTETRLPIFDRGWAAAGGKSIAVAGVYVLQPSANLSGHFCGFLTWRLRATYGWTAAHDVARKP